MLQRRSNRQASKRPTRPAPAMATAVFEVFMSGWFISGILVPYAGFNPIRFDGFRIDLSHSRGHPDKERPV